MGIIQEVRRMVKSHKDIPLIYNINNAEPLGERGPSYL